MIEIRTIEPIKQDDGKFTLTFRMLGMRQRPSTEEEISEWNWLSEFYEALLDVEHGQAELETREKSSRVCSKIELSVSEGERVLFLLLFAQRRPKNKTNEYIQMINKEVYEKNYEKKTYI